MSAAANAFKPLKKADIATTLGVTPRTVENWVSAGLIPAPTDLGGRVFWHPEMFYTWLDEYLRGKNFYTKNKTLEINDECHVKPPSRRRKAHSQSTSRIAAIEFISNEID